MVSPILLRGQETKDSLLILTPSAQVEWKTEDSFSPAITPISHALLCSPGSLHSVLTSPGLLFSSAESSGAHLSSWVMELFALGYFQPDRHLSRTIESLTRTKKEWNWLLLIGNLQDEEEWVPPSQWSSLTARPNFRAQSPSSAPVHSARPRAFQFLHEA